MVWTTKNGLDIEYWEKLARDNPQAFEEKRVQLIETFIAGQSEESREKLRQMQWQIDSVRDVSASPASSCRRIFEMMIKKICGNRGFFDSLSFLVGDDAEFGENQAKGNKAKVLDLNSVKRGKGKVL